MAELGVVGFLLMDDCFFDLDGDGVEEFGVVVKALGDDGENMVPEVNYFI